MSIEKQLSAVLDVLRQSLETNVLGAYLYGSAVEGALRPRSDLDILVVTASRTTTGERRQLIELLTPISDRRLRPADWRPVELTVIVESDVKPWRYPARIDLQWGEWLRSDLDSGRAPGSSVNPDLAVLIAMVLLAGRPLLGPAQRELLDPVPWTDVVSAMRDGVPGLLTDLDTDTTNVLLTLARICNTLETSEFVSKDVAADWATTRFPDMAPALVAARAMYLGEIEDSWAGLESEARAAADSMVEAALRTES